MPRPSHFLHHTLSRRVTRRRYPEEWAWWDAAGWQIVVEDAPDGGLRLRSYWSRGARSALWGANATPEEATTPNGVRLFLVEALYLHLHPRKAKLALATTGQVCTAQQLAAFIRAQQRKVGK